MLTPQMMNEIRSHVVARIVGYHADHEYTVRLQIDAQEVLQSRRFVNQEIVDQRDALSDPFISLVWYASADPFHAFDQIPNVDH